MKKGKEKKETEEDLPGYPHYPVKDDYNKEKELTDVNPENPSKRKSPNQPPHVLNEKDFEEDVSGGDLDVPGAELDDAQESIGSEDEENNLYSLGGDKEDQQDENADVV